MGRAAFGPTIAGVGHCWDWELLGGGFAPHDEHLLLMMSFSDIRPGFGEIRPSDILRFKYTLDCSVHGGITLRD